MHPLEFGVRLGGGRSYPVIVGGGALARLPALLSGLAAARCAVISDSNVAPLHGETVAGILRRAGRATSLIPFPAGETHKTRATKEILEDAMLTQGFGPDSLVVAAGGGVTIDLAGYVAATYMRGVPWVAVPTSLLAMADAAIGGKTGVDVPSGKNLIGAYHQPIAVLADTSFLATLPAGERLEGLAEIVKAGIIADAGLFEAIERSASNPDGGTPDALLGLLVRSIAVKVRVVSEDERESDLRKILNYGHTVGHALERLTGYAISHGRAISIGMAAEARMSVALGLMGEGDAARIGRVLSALGLPTRLPEPIEPASVLEAARVDKKARAGRIEYSLPRAIGAMAKGETGHTRPVPDEIAARALA